VLRYSTVYDYVFRGAVLCNDTDSDDIDSVLALDTIEMVAERLLEPVPVGDVEPMSVQGRLHGHTQLEVSVSVKEIITQGYRIPFLKVSWPLFKRIHRSALEHDEFVATAIEVLVQTGCVVPQNSALQFVVHICCCQCQLHVELELELGIRN
jgi:hypothetical protein